MRRSNTVRALFWELRAAGIDGSAKDVLRLAHLLLRSHQGEIGRLSDYGRIVDSRALPMLPVDVVMASSGWRVVEFENSRAHLHEPDTADVFSELRRIEGRIGRLWPRSIPQD